MKKILFVFLLGFVSWLHAWAGVGTTQPVADLVNRVCGAGAADHFSFVLNPQLSQGKEAFQLGYANGKVTVTGSSLSALTTGLNWYLKHDAHVHISWNNLTETPASYPVPKDQQVHASASEYRYYLNYCTFSYSMSMWDEARWMKELDWMALHGINLPLQIVGIDAVWYQMLTQDFGFTHEQANDFVVGPAFQGWWLMNNIVRLGGPNPEWWYKRSAALGKKITDRMRELGMKPCLPGFVGMVPRKYVTDRGLQSFKMDWCRMQSPDILEPSQVDAFNALAQKYYERIKKVYGFAPEHYSLDPIHEHALPGGMTAQHYKSLCDNARLAMDKWGVPAGKKGVWVAQEWQTNADQHRIDALPAENTLLLDLSSERLTYVDRFGAHPYLFCMLHNYGGNIGLYGRIADMLKRYQMHVDQHSNILRGVGATPEGIETNPVLYDLLFELPWYQHVPDAQAWLNEYTECRYDMNSPEAKDAWSNLLVTLYNDLDDHQQGCREPVFCARPNLDGNGASEWAYADFDWDKAKVIRAAYQMLAVDGKNANYTYDMVDIVRQALSDYGHTLQMDMKVTSQREGFKSPRFAKQSDAFLALIDDLDAFLGTLSDFRVGRFTEDARRIAMENNDAAKQDWMEHNIRMLFSTWGENGEILDYANREYQGMMADYYKPRWVLYFNDLKANGGCGRNFLEEVEKPWMKGDATKGAAFGKYTAAAQPTQYGDAKATAQALMNKYFGTVKGGAYYTAYTDNDFSATVKVPVSQTADLNGVFERMHSGVSIAAYALDLDQDGVLDAERTINTPLAIPVMAATDVKARIVLSDGTRIDFLATIGKELAQGRLVCASTNDPALGTVQIKGSATNATFSKGGVVLQAQPLDHHLFLGWMKKDLSFASAANPFVYADASSESFQACFGKNLWKTVEVNPAGPGETKEHSAYVKKFEYSINGGAYHTIYTADAAPTQLHLRVDQPIRVKAGDQLTLRWEGGNGLSYCYLTAYVDDAAGARGTFNNCFHKYGTKGAQTNDLVNNSATYTVSSNLTDGMTTLRLRFDGAWNDANWDEANQRFHADGVTNRPVYDFTLLLGETTHTPVFDRFTTNGWEVACQETAAHQLALTGAWPTGQQTAFTVPASVEGAPFGSQTMETYEVVSLDENFFAANPAMTEIQLPATVQQMGSAPTFTTVAENKNGAQQTLDLGTTLPADGWSIEADVKMPAAALNGWGSCVMASGNNAFDGPFDEGFQLYLYAPNHPEGKQGLCVKTMGHVETILGPGEIFDLYNKEVKIKLSYTTGQLVCQFSAGQEKAEKTINCTIRNVSQLTWAMKDDALYHRIRYSKAAAAASVADIIARGTSLQAIQVAQGNKQYSSQDGVLYSADQTTLLALPAALKGTVNLPAAFQASEGQAMNANQQVLFRVEPAHYAQLRATQALPPHRASIDLSQDWDAATFAQNLSHIGTDALGEVSLQNRQLSAMDWNTLSLPFALTETEAAQLFAETYVLRKVESKTADHVTLVFGKASATDLQQAGQPLLVKMNDGATLTFRQKNLVAQPREVQVQNAQYQVQMVGNFDFRQLTNQEFVIRQNKFYVADAPVNLRGYRAHMVVRSLTPTAAAPRELQISTDDTLTGMEHVEVAQPDAPIYSLDGRRVADGQAVKGVYIQGGKKIIR